MTKDAYFDMCTELNIEPIDEEIPLEYTDFPDIVQTSFIIYSKLSDIWDTMNGGYIGKDYSIVFNLFELYDIDEKSERLLILDFIQMMDSSRKSIVANKMEVLKKSQSKK